MRIPVLLISLSLLAGPATLAAAPEDLPDAFERLKEAQTKNDAPSVKQLAAQVHKLAAEAIAAPAPGDPEAKAAWTSAVDYAKSADLFSEYALVATGLRSEPAVLIDLMATVEAQNPKSRYLDDAYASYLYALSKTGASAKIPVVAEKALPNFPENEDLLLVMFDHEMAAKQTDRAVGYGNRLIAVMTKHAKPANVPAADWERKRTLALGRSYLLVGATAAERGQYMAADRNLRAALPLIKGTSSMMAPALFHLGMANYKLGLQTLNKRQVLEGASFSDQCAAIDSPYADQARRNAIFMRRDAQGMR